MPAYKTVALLALFMASALTAPVATPIDTEAVSAEGFLGEEEIWNSGKYVDSKKRAETEAVSADGFLGEEEIWNSGKYVDSK
ncbi:hypothetical protein SCUP234_09252 [Seiridium cupressi]